MNYSRKVDKLGNIKAQIALLKKECSLIETELKGSGLREINSKNFRVVISNGTRENVDWKKISMKLSPSRQLVRGNTSFAPFVKINITKHKK